MGVGTYGFVYLAIDFSSLISPIIIGAQLSVPFGLILCKIFLNEIISFKKWILIFLSFVGIVIVAYDPRFGEEIIGLIFVILMAFFYSISNILSKKFGDTWTGKTPIFKQLFLKMSAKKLEITHLKP